MLLAITANAQTRSRSNSRSNTTDTVPALVKSYMDSLNVSRTRIDSTYNVADTTKETQPNGKYYRFFIPLTFYHNITKSAFDISSNDEGCWQDETLRDIYLQRPDLVQTTQSQLDVAGPTLKPRQETVAPDVDIVKKVEPKTNDATIDSPINIYVEKPNFWKFSGDYSLQMFQNYISGNWYKGGESSYSMIAAVTLQANYNNKQKFRWDNKLEMRLGFQNTRGDTLHTVRTSEDLIRYTGKLGLQASKKWYYTLQLIASTQFMRGLKSNDHL